MDHCWKHKPKLKVQILTRDLLVQFHIQTLKGEKKDIENRICEIGRGCWRRITGSWRLGSPAVSSWCSGFPFTFFSIARISWVLNLYHFLSCLCFPIPFCAHLLHYFRLLFFLTPPWVISRLNDTVYTQGRPSPISSQIYISTASSYGIIKHSQKCALLIL